MPFFFMMVSDDSGLKPRLECLITVLLGKYKIKIHPFLSTKRLHVKMLQFMRMVIRLNYNLTDLLWC